EVHPQDDAVAAAGREAQQRGSEEPAHGCIVHQGARCFPARRGTMAHTAAIIGGTGYGGAEILRHLLRHPDVRLARVTAADNIGKNVGEVHLNLAGLSDLVFEEMPARDAAKGCDVVFLALPHRTSAKVAMELFETGVKIVDLSGDFRLRDAAAYQRD